MKRTNWLSGLLVILMVLSVTGSFIQFDADASQQKDDAQLQDRVTSSINDPVPEGFSASMPTTPLE